MIEIARRGKGESGAFAPSPKLRKKVDLDAAPRKRCVQTQRRDGALFRGPGDAARGAKTPTTTNPSGALTSGVTRSKSWSQKTSAPYGSLLVLTSHLGSQIGVCKDQGAKN